jgi:glycosyltransferase involved in cell wall biosynthesis
MKDFNKTANRTGLFVLGSLYPDVTGGMEIFNYYFLQYQLGKYRDSIYYAGEKKFENEAGNFVLLKRRWPVRIFYPFQFFYIVYRLRKMINYAYLSYAEQSWIIVFSQALVFRLFKIPYIVTIHWGKEPDWKFSYPFKYFFLHAHTVIGVSEPICIAFKRTIPEQEFKYIPPLIPFQHSSKIKATLKAELGYSLQEKILLFVGSLKAMKNPDKIIEAFFKIGPEYLENHDIRMILVGTGEMEKDLITKVENYGLGKYIRLTGLMGRNCIPDYYKVADAYIISSDYEGTSLSLLEAMFNKLIIIGSDAPGINKMLTHEKNALLYETTNIAELAETIKRAFSDSFLMNKLSERAYLDFNNMYAYESVTEKYQAVFSSVPF